jgi:hypothetical protein
MKHKIFIITHYRKEFYNISHYGNYIYKRQKVGTNVTLSTFAGRTNELTTRCCDDSIPIILTAVFTEVVHFK